MYYILMYKPRNWGLFFSRFVHYSMHTRRNMEKKEKVGKIAVDLLAKADDKHTVGEQMREQLSEYDQDLYVCFEINKKKYDSRFYIVVLTRSVPNLPNILRHQFFARRTCPTPGYDQCVYQCHKDWPEPKFVWVIPSKEYSEHMHNNRDMVPLEEYELLRFVLDYYDGTLLKLCKLLNNEKEDTGQLILEK
jgi:hypothetical protein